VVPTAGGEKGPRVLANNQEGATIVPGLYAAGWLKRGPSGIIGSNVTDGKEASAAVLADYLSEASLNLPDSEVKVGNGNECSSHSKKGYDALKALVTERTAAQSRAEKSQLPVSWNAWQAIDATEVAQGEQIEKPRAKLTSVADLLSAAVGNPE
jgi:NADPH-dependent glutamate synthase beta subunit-like oxidoreductase